MPHAQAVFAEQAPYVLRVLRHLGVPESDLPDVAQDVFMVVFRKLEGFEGRSSLRTWIYGICLRVTSDYRRKRGRQRALFSDDARPLQRAQSEPNQLTGLCERRRLRALQAALELLSPEQQRAVVLADIEQQSMHQVAAALGCPLKTAFSRLYAARRKLREALGGNLTALLPGLCPPAALTQAGDAARLSALYRRLGSVPGPFGKGPGLVAAKSGLGGCLSACLVAATALMPAFSTSPLPLHLAMTDPPKTAPLRRSPFTSVPQAQPRAATAQRSPGSTRRLSAPAPAQSMPPPETGAFAVEHHAVPNAHLIFVRVALSEVVPFYAIPRE